jgi:hypothetical protein
MPPIVVMARPAHRRRACGLENDSLLRARIEVLARLASGLGSRYIRLVLLLKNSYSTIPLEHLAALAGLLSCFGLRHFYLTVSALTTFAFNRRRLETAHRFGHEGPNLRNGAAINDVPIQPPRFSNRSV